ncbi:OmpH family outer membrane protein [Reichenbachiella sp. MALMAid0571]|uniref:OmpH family outer membrane protein n=1 Tax=Reichenbachiella sp. MALMAid0571 TaxID=3143939 RepID=UPI0032DEC310
MKIKSLIFVFVSTILAFTAQAQEFKIGYTNVEYILSLMPELKGIEAEYKAFETQLQNQIQAKGQEFQTKGQEYQANAATMTELVRADKEAELQGLKQRLDAFQQEAQKSAQKKQQELFAPLFDKIGKAIKDVQSENGYAMILSTGTQGLDVVLAADEKYDVNNLIFKKLGITPPADQK